MSSAFFTYIKCVVKDTRACIKSLTFIVIAKETLLTFLSNKIGIFSITSVFAVFLQIGSSIFGFKTFKNLDIIIKYFQELYRDIVHIFLEKPLSWVIFELSDIFYPYFPRWEVEIPDWYANAMLLSAVISRSFSHVDRFSPVKTGERAKNLGKRSKEQKENEMNAEGLLGKVHVIIERLNTKIYWGGVNFIQGSTLGPDEIKKLSGIRRVIIQTRRWIGISIFSTLFLWGFVRPLGYIIVYVSREKYQVAKLSGVDISGVPEIQRKVFIYFVASLLIGFIFSAFIFLSDDIFRFLDKILLPIFT